MWKEGRNEGKKETNKWMFSQPVWSSTKGEGSMWLLSFWVFGNCLYWVITLPDWLAALSEDVSCLLAHNMLRFDTKELTELFSFWTKIAHNQYGWETICLNSSAARQCKWIVQFECTALCKNIHVPIIIVACFLFTKMQCQYLTTAMNLIQGVKCLSSHIPLYGR